QTVHKLFRSSPVGMKIKNLLNGTPFQHRLHPAMVVVPLGAWTTAFVFDLLEGSAGRDRAVFRRAADISIAAGVLGALPSAKSGTADWVDLYDHRRRVGMAHALLNATALTCYVASLALRNGSSSSRGAAKLLSGTGFGLVLLGGALGGDM